MVRGVEKNRNQWISGIEQLCWEEVLGEYVVVCRVGILLLTLLGRNLYIAEIPPMHENLEVHGWGCKGVRVLRHVCFTVVVSCCLRAYPAAGFQLENDRRS